MPTLLRKMNVISRCGGLYRTAELADTELGAIHHGFVFAVCRNPGLSQDQLARRMYLNKSTVTRRLTFLEERGYVTRVPSESDKRVQLVYPTEKMQALLPRVREVTDAWNSAVVEGIDEEELALFHSVLDRITERAKDLAHLEELGEDT